MMMVIKFDGKGKQMICLESQSEAMLKLWALQNTTNKQMSIVKNEETDEITLVVQGNGKGNYPTVVSDKFEIQLLGIEIS